MELWIPFTLMAAFMQSWRNALQKKLRDSLTTSGATLSRFILAGPLAALYLIILYQYYPEQHIPNFSSDYMRFVFISATAQIFATVFMVMLFSRRNYAIGVGLAKSEALMAAALGALFFAAPLNVTAWVGVLVGALAILLMSKPDQTHPSLSTLTLGLASGLCFALCTLYLREASLTLELPFLLAAAWVLLWIISLQTIMLIIWIALREPNTFNDLIQHKTTVASVSVFGFFGSLGWFTAMSLVNVALVKTLGQIEILFTLMISRWWFNETLKKTDYWGLLLIVISAILVIYA